MSDRNLYDLSHFSHRCGKIGRLQTISILPIVAGDSMEIDLDGIVRLSPFRKEVVSETQVDLFAFYVPYRHVYGSDFIDMVKQGYDETVTLGGVALSSGERDCAFLTLNEAPASIPKWLLQGYNRIWDRYFRVPSFPQDTDYETYPTGSSANAKDYRLYGRLCARLPHILNGGNYVSNATESAWRDLTETDATVSGPVFEGATASFDIRDVAKIQGQLKSEIERTWMSERYTDLLEKVWGTGVNIDADQRPELVFRETFMMSGHDVDGHDDAALGTYIGKTVSRCSMNIPRKYFAEHGTLWIMGLLRFPLVNAYEKHPLATTVNPSGVDLLADPLVWAEREPVAQDPSNWVSGSTAYWDKTETPGLLEPYGQHYRAHNNYVHRNFADIPGYPFSRVLYDDPEQVYYHAAEDYSDVFQTSQLGHWQLHARLNVKALRHVPDVLTSIYAGT